MLIYTAIVVGYALGGAYLFSYLERTREVQYNAKIDRWKNDTAILLATELRQVTPHEEVWARKVFRYLELYEKDLLKASALGYRRQDYRDREQRWTWTSSLFFSVSLMTTTGKYFAALLQEVILPLKTGGNLGYSLKRFDFFINRII